MKVCVVGAGASGLIAAKHLSQAGMDFDLFEASERIGGTWVYSDNFIDKHGQEISSSMYKNLKTNLPKELMLFEGLDYDIDGASFIPASDVLKYLQKFADKFNLNSKIKFEHLIVKISKINESWEVVVKNLSDGLQNIKYYDSVFVCNGHYSVPSYPDICGAGSFPGSHLHSHYYRAPELYQRQAVLIVGLGPSAVDITFDIAPHANKVYLSHHGPNGPRNPFPENVIHKPDVQHIDGQKIHFLDGSSAEVDSILYCTGYKYNFPFLDESCGIKVQKNYVSPLYRQLVSIPHSSMFFIGLPFRSFIFPMLELQVACAVRVLSGSVALPEREVMSAETLAWEEALAAAGVPQSKFHCIGPCVRDYLDSIAVLGQLPPLPPVLFHLLDACVQHRKQDLANYRERVFSIVDSNNFNCK